MPDPVGGWGVVKLPQYVEEATYGTFPTNPAMQWIAPIASADLKADMQSVTIPQLGIEDLKYIIKGAEQYTFDLEYPMQNSTFAKYGVNPQGGGAGAIDKSLSLLFSAKLGGVVSGTENYVQVLGSRINSITLSSQVGQQTNAKVNLFAKSIPVPSSASPLGSGSAATDPGTNPWMFYDGGTNPVTIGAVNPDVREISVSVNRNLERVYVLGSSQQKFQPPKQRRISGSFTIVWEDTNQYTNLTSDTGVTIAWVLKSATSTLTLNNCKITREDSFKFTPTEIVYEKYSFSALTGSLS